MDYEAVLAQVLDLLQREKCLSYRVLKRRLGVDDDELEDLKEDFIYAKKLALDEENRVLVWTGESATSREVAALPAQTTQQPVAQGQHSPQGTPLLTVPPPDAERRQLTVMFGVRSTIRTWRSFLSLICSNGYCGLKPMRLLTRNGRNSNMR